MTKWNFMRGVRTEGTKRKQCQQILDFENSLFGHKN